LGQNVPKYEKPGSGTAPLPHRLDGAQSRRLLIGPDVGRGRGSTSSRHEKRQQAKRPLSLMSHIFKS